MNRPEKQLHSDQLTATLSSYLDERLSDQENSNKFVQNIGSTLGSMTIEKVVEKRMTITNCLLFNIAYVRWEDKNMAVSIGLFNHVFPLNKEEIRTTFNEWSLF